MTGSTGLMRNNRLALVVALFVHAGAAFASNPGPEWSRETEEERLTIFSRARPGSAQREFRGIGVLEATPATVAALLEDRSRYPEFMPYIAECRVLQRKGERLFVYQRLKVPLLSDRDYTQQVIQTTRASESGPVYEIRWSPANDQGPAPLPGVTRLDNFDGSWLLEPTPDGGTRATFTVFTETAGLPALFANKGTRASVAKLFSALRRRLRTEKGAG